MKKFLPVAVVLALAAVAAVAFWFWQKGNKAIETDMTGKVATEMKEGTLEEDEGFTGDLKQALKLGKSMKCSWKMADDNYATAYISKNRVYYEAFTEGKEARVISVDNCSYTWTVGEPQGLKVCAEETEVDGSEVETPEAFSWEAAGMSYQCQPFTVSESVFDPPADVNFLSPQELMEGLKLPGADEE